MSTLTVWLLPSLIPAGVLDGSVAVVVDLIRASTTITRALDAGAAYVRPCLEPEDALAMRADLVVGGHDPARIVLGGERGGARIPGFDLGNSPAEYTPERVGGRIILFTTTNGTRALLAAREGGASRIVMACFNVLTAVVEQLSREERPVHIICAGSNGAVTIDDIACAGAIAAGLQDCGWTLSHDDGARVALAAWTAARSHPGGLAAFLHDSRAGRNLRRIGLEADVDDCARMEIGTLAPELDADGVLRRGPT